MFFFVRDGYLDVVTWLFDFKGLKSVIFVWVIKEKRIGCKLVLEIFILFSEGCILDVKGEVY